MLINHIGPRESNLFGTTPEGCHEYCGVLRSDKISPPMNFSPLQPYWDVSCVVISNLPTTYIQIFLIKTFLCVTTIYKISLYINNN